MVTKPKKLQFVQEAAAQILDSLMPSGCAVTICAGRGGLACAGSVWRHALQVSDNRNVEGKRLPVSRATMKRHELTIGGLPRCWMPWTWRLTGRWRSLSRRQLCYRRLVRESEISSSNPPVLFRTWRVFLCLRGASYIRRWTRSTVQLRFDVQDDPCDRVVVCGLRRELDLGEGDDTESDDQKCSRRGDAGKVFHRDLILMM